MTRIDTDETGLHGLIILLFVSVIIRFICVYPWLAVLFAAFAA